MYLRVLVVRLSLLASCLMMVLLLNGFIMAKGFIQKKIRKNTKSSRMALIAHWWLRTWRRRNREPWGLRLEKILVPPNFKYKVRIWNLCKFHVFWNKMSRSHLYLRVMLVFCNASDKDTPCFNGPKFHSLSWRNDKPSKSHLMNFRKDRITTVFFFSWVHLHGFTLKWLY